MEYCLDSAIEGYRFSAQRPLEPALAREGGKYKIVFLIHAPETLSALEPVIDELGCHPAEFELHFFAIPRNYTGHRGVYSGSEKTFNFLKNKFSNVKVLRGSKAEDLESLKSLAPDFVFRQSPWDNHIPSMFSATSLSFTALCYIPYGMMTAKIPSQQYNQDLHNHCAMIFCESDFHLQEYKKFREKKSDDVHDTGYPRLEWLIRKFDELARTGLPEQYWPIKAGQHLPKVIWAPHHSITSGWLNYSTFLNYKDEMLQHAQSGKISILFRPHPALREKLLSARAMSEKQYDNYVEQFNATGTSQIDLDKEYIHSFHASDFMITDGVGFFSEYILTNKPLIHTVKSRSHPLNEFGNWLTESFRKVSNSKELQEAIQEMSLGQYRDDEKEGRLARASVIREISVGASQRIVQHLFNHAASARKAAKPLAQ